MINAELAEELNRIAVNAARWELWTPAIREAARRLCAPLDTATLDAIRVVCDCAEGQLNAYDYDENNIRGERRAIETLRRLAALPKGELSP